MNTPIPHPITRIKTETPQIKTFEFKSKTIAEYAKPGQFLMIWIPGIDEKPMSLSHIGHVEDHWTIGVTVACVGEATERLHSFCEGTMVGLRGPFGRGFTIEKGLISDQTVQKNFLLVGGGCGVASLRPLIHLLLKQGCNLTCIVGAKTKDELLFEEEFELLYRSQKRLFRYITCTDDGSWGFHGTTAQRMREELEQHTFQQIYTCGPELMMKQVYELAQQKEIPFQASLAERIIKCAMGICGQCVLDPLGVRLCIEGPVFSGQDLTKIEDFGKTTRNKAGQRISLQS